jgi:glucosamine--fructose-6-phosphate aminotransferase (isomerizing)
MVIGVAEGETFIASDVPALLNYTRDIYYVDDMQSVRVLPGEVHFFDLNGDEVEMETTHITWDAGAAEKGGFEHFMIKEIHEQPKAIRDTLSSVIHDGKIDLSAAGLTNDVLSGISEIHVVACGSAWHAGMVGKYVIEDLAEVPVSAEIASEFRYKKMLLDKDALVVIISQSGETADTLAAVELAKQRGAFVYVICNVVGSSIARATHSGSYIHVGPEVGVASTKAFTGQVTTLAMMTITIAKERGTITPERYVEMIKAVQSLPEKMNIVLKQREKIEELSKIFTYANNFIYLGRGYNYPAALEGALKLKEISYIHAEGYPAAEMKHGPIALIDAEMPVVAIATSDSIYGKSISNIQEIKARSGRILALVSEGDNQIKDIVDYVIEVPEIDEFLVPILTSIPLQLLAYFIAVNKRRDVDRPRNLAKSVTVE